MFDVPFDAAVVYLVLLTGYWLIACRQIRWSWPTPKAAELHSSYCWRHVMFRLHLLLLLVAVAALLVLLLAWDAELTLTIWFRPLTLGLVFVTLTTTVWCLVAYLWFIKVWLFESQRRH